jgi:putative two-component system response regulator
MQVVIIDDAQINVTLLQHLVRKIPGCEPVGFTDPLVGLDWCLANKPDILVVDYMMPQLKGTELVERFRRVPGYADIPVLMVTANHEMDVRRHALQMGVTDFLNKPVDDIEFIARAARYVGAAQESKLLEDPAA